MSKDVMAQLDLLKSLTATTGVLHDLQVTQLKNWPLLVIPDSTFAEASFDYKDKLVTYKVKAKKKAFKGKKERLSSLAEYTKVLLGDEYNIEVYINGGLIFNSEPNE